MHILTTLIDIGSLRFSESDTGEKKRKFRTMS